MAFAMAQYYCKLFISQYGQFNQEWNSSQNALNLGYALIDTKLFQKEEIAYHPKQLTNRLINIEGYSISDDWCKRYAKSTVCANLKRALVLRKST
jgi:hypothetical protein